jgi:hypothetical protein
MPSPSEIDEVIMAAVEKRWLKVAMVVVNVMTEMERAGIEIDAEVIGARIEALIGQGKLQCQGDPKLWRRSEVRLPRVQADGH